MSIPESHADVILNRLECILERLDRLEARLDKTEQALHEMPGMAATVVNTLDELSAPLRMQGSLWPERLPALLRLLEQWTQPEILDKLEYLSARKAQFLPWLNLLADLPDLLSTGVDSLDAEAAALKAAGTDLSNRLEPLLKLLLEVSKPEYLSILEQLSRLLPILARPAMLEALESLAQHADQFAPWLKLLTDLPGLLNVGINGLDESMAHLKNTGGIDIQERGRALLQVVLQATDPRTLHLLSELLMQRETLLMGVYALRDLPGILSMAVDSLDEFFRNYDLSGHDIDHLLHSLRHGILDVHTVSVVASAGEALARSEKDYQPASLFQMLKALGTPEFRNSMGFLLSFVRHFSHSLQASSLPHSN